MEVRAQRPLELDTWYHVRIVWDGVFDGGLRLYRLDASSGQMISQVVLDDLDPESKKNLQARIQGLQMPVALPDILSSDGQRIYMKSQVFDMEGKRQQLGPHSAGFPQQASVQGGPQAHIFCPTGFLDDTMWHRTYWVYGRSFAGGHGGYHQAGRFAPSGKILVTDETNVYGFGRKPQYYRWSTTIEHQLFAASKKAPKIEPPATARKEGAKQRRGGKKPGAKKPGFHVKHIWNGDVKLFACHGACRQYAVRSRPP